MSGKQQIGATSIVALLDDQSPIVSKLLKHV
jgi:hypothetical protein